MPIPRAQLDDYGRALSDVWMAMEQQRLARLRERLRAEIDPEAARRLTLQERAQRAMAFQPVGAAMSMAGLGGPASIAGAFLGGGPAGGIMAIAGQLIQTIQGVTTALGQMGKAVLSFEPEGVMRGFVNLAGQIPIVGGIISTFGNTILDASNAIGSTAQRLAQYSPELAMQQAQIELRRVQRDIDRAQRFGDQIVRNVELREEINERIQELIDKWAPVALRLVEAILTWLSKIFGVSTDTRDYMRQMSEAINATATVAFTPQFSAFLAQPQNVPQAPLIQPSQGPLQAFRGV